MEIRCVYLLFPLNLIFRHIPFSMHSFMLSSFMCTEIPICEAIRSKTCMLCILKGSSDYFIKSLLFFTLQPSTRILSTFRLRKTGPPGGQTCWFLLSSVFALAWYLFQESMLSQGTGLSLKSGGNRRGTTNSSGPRGTLPTCISMWQQCLWLEIVRTDLGIPSPSEKRLRPCSGSSASMCMLQTYCRERVVHLADQRCLFLFFSS